MKESDIPKPEITSADFIGRKTIRKIIDKAINDLNNLNTVIIQGAGGIGKTSVLRWVKTQYGQDNKDIFEESTPLLVTGTIDFFDISLRDKAGFLEKVCQELKPGHESLFTNFETLLANYGELKLAGVSPTTLAREQKKIIEAFNNDYVELAKRIRIVLLIDTFELVQDDLGEWLAEWLAVLPNTCAMIAGRENEAWHPIMEKAARPSKVVFHQLEEFTDGDTEEFFVIFKVKIKRQIDEDVRHKIQILTNGIPVLIAMTLDWHDRDIPVDDLTETSGRYTLEKLRHKTDTELNWIREVFKRELIERFMDQSDHNRAIQYMALAYKYFPYKLAAYLLEDISLEETRDLLEKLSDWSFIKFNEQLKTYQLHDLIRDMILEYVWKNIDFDGRTRREIYQKIVDYYDIKISVWENREIQYREDLRAADLNGNRSEANNLANKIIALKKIKQYRKIEMAYYDLLSENESALSRYQFLFADLIWARETEAFEQLRRGREEAFWLLGKSYPAYRILFEEARINIAIDGNFEGGLTLIEDKILPLVRPDKDRILFAAIRLYQGIAYHSTGENKRGESLLLESIDALNNLRNEVVSEENWKRIIRLQARSYINLGYLRFTSSRYTEAIPAYKEAIRCSISAGMNDIKSAAQNDLSYIYARQGDYDIARKLCRESIRLREQLGRSYYVGLGYNTLGQIEFLADNETSGSKHCRQALAYFSQMGDTRGIMLANRALGMNLTKQGRYLLYLGNQAEATERFKEAEGHLRESEKIASEGQEAKYLIDICLYFGWLYQNCGESERSFGNINHSTDYFKKSESYYRQAIDYSSMNESKWDEIYNRERLFSLYHLMDNDGLAEAALKEMETAFDNAGTEISWNVHGAPQIPSNLKNKEYLYLLGKLLRGKGRMAFRKYMRTQKDETLKKSAEQYALACAYIQMYSKNVNGLKTTCQEVIDLVNRLEIGQAKSFQDHIAQTILNYELNQYSELNRLLERADGLF